MVITSESGIIDAKYSKQGQGLIGISSAVGLFASGKRGDLLAGQSDK
jgi:hypothetical protein